MFLYFNVLKTKYQRPLKLIFNCVLGGNLSYNPPIDPEVLAKINLKIITFFKKKKKTFLINYYNLNLKFFFFKLHIKNTLFELIKQIFLNTKLSSNILSNYNRKNFIFFKKNKTKFMESFLGFFDFLKKFKITVYSMIVGIILLFFMMYNHSLSTQKILAIWFLGFANIYWLFSTFVFFKKKYHWGRFTSANQRFWKRTLLIFWILEFFLFGIFLYLSLNSNSESYYMLDQIQIYKEFLYPVRPFIINLFLYFVIILVLYLLILSLKWQVFNKVTILFLMISYTVSIIFFNEIYQFFHVINHYSNVDWEYDSDAEIWTIEFESRKERTWHHYSLLLFILKFWHIVFIVFVWFFFLLRGLEIKRFYYPSLAGNLNNFIFLYLFNWLFMTNWVKFLVIYVSTYTFFEFFLQIRENLVSFFFFDLILIDIYNFFYISPQPFKEYSFLYNTILFALND